MDTNLCDPPCTYYCGIPCVLKGLKLQSLGVITVKANNIMSSPSYIENLMEPYLCAPPCTYYCGIPCVLKGLEFGIMTLKLMM